MILNGFLVGLSIFRRCLWSFVYTLPSFLTRVVLFPLFSFSWLWSHISNQSCNCKSKRKEWVSINHKHGIRSVDAYLDATVNFISGLLYSKEPFSLIPTVSESLESSLWSLSQTFLRNVFFRYIFFLCFFVSGQWTHTQNWTTRFPFACFLSLGHEKMRRQVKNGYINKKEKRHQHIHRFHSRHSRGNDRLSRNESESSKGKSTDLSFQEHDESRNTADDSFCCWYHQLSRSEGESARELLNVKKKGTQPGFVLLEMLYSLFPSIICMKPPRHDFRSALTCPTFIRVNRRKTTQSSRGGRIRNLYVQSMACPRVSSETNGSLTVRYKSTVLLHLFPVFHEKVMQ